jgi:hypothetical protein
MNRINKIEPEIQCVNSTRYLSPIMRVQKKNAIKKHNSVKAFIPNTATHTIEFRDFEPNSKHNKNVLFTGKNSNNNTLMNKCNSVANFHKFCKTKKSSNDKIPIKRNTIYNNFIDNKFNSMDCSIKEKNNNNNKKETNKNKCDIKKNKANSLKNKNDRIFNDYKNFRKKKLLTKTTQDLTKSNIERDLYCFKCYNRNLLPFDNTKIPFKNINKSYDCNYYHSPLELKKIDEDYINKKVLENEQKQLMAFNKLKDEDIEHPKTRTEILQSINENEDNPLIGFNLQDYLYYNNKNNNEKLNNKIIENINLYKVNNPRKEIKDYYKNVQYQIPLLEKKFGPSKNYKSKYIETLKKQMNDKVKERDKLRQIKIKTELEEIKKYNEFLSKLKKDEFEQKKLKQKIFVDNNKYIEEYRKKKEQILRKDQQNGLDDKMKKFHRNQKEYNDFIKQQRLNEINSLQNWINESLKQKREKLNKKENEDERWKKYHKEFNDYYKDNIHADKCAECNLIKTNRLYPIKTS